MVNGAFTVEKGIPLPIKRSASSLFPFAEMLVGDSFAVPLPPNRTKEQLRSNVTACAHGFAKRQPQPQEWRFVTAFEQKEGRAVGVRIWRSPPKNVALRSLPLGAPDDAAPPFVDPVKVVEAKGYRVRKQRASIETERKQIPPPEKMPRFVQGKGRY